MIRTMTQNIDTLRDTRAASVLTFREQIDYDARVATSPGIKTICEVISAYPVRTIAAYTGSNIFWQQELLKAIEVLP